MKKLSILTLAVLWTGLAWAAPTGSIYVTGKVTAPGGKPIVEAMISLKGNPYGTMTDSRGQYNFTAPPDVVLVFSAPGYLAKEESVAGRTEIDVQLEPDPDAKSGKKTDAPEPADKKKKSRKSRRQTE